jgi:hypothetical protein
MEDIEARREYLARVEKHRGKEAADSLREAVKKEWNINFSTERKAS